jgi:hypothetical protein
MAGGTPAGTCNCPMLSQPKSAVHQHPAKLSWQIISGALLLFSGSVALFASYWSAGFERFRQPPDLVSHWLGGFAGGAPTLLVRKQQEANPLLSSTRD